MIFIGTVNNMTWYAMNGIGYVRCKSRLTGKRVKSSPEFKKTMEYARKLGEASTVASGLYKAIPDENKSSRLFRLITGRVVTCFKKGITEDEVREEVRREIPSLIKQVKKEM